jgi:hypothetical protein
MKRSGRSIAWLCNQLRAAIADEMERIDIYYQFEKYGNVGKCIDRLRPAQYFCPELKEQLDSLEERIHGDSGVDNSPKAQDESKV